MVPKELFHIYNSVASHFLLLHIYSPLCLEFLLLGILFIGLFHNCNPLDWDTHSLSICTYLLFIVVIVGRGEQVPENKLRHVHLLLLMHQNRDTLPIVPHAYAVYKKRKNVMRGRGWSALKSRQWSSFCFSCTVRLQDEMRPTQQNDCDVFRKR